MVCNDAVPLFDRLQPGLFRLLGMPNGQRYWTVLSRLMEELWGDGAHSPGEEIPKTSVVRSVEAFLATDDPWDGELETNITIRANEIANKLIENDWLSSRRRGVVTMLTVKPLVAQFYAVLCDFATQEPEFIGSKFRSILLNLQSMQAADEGGEQYVEAARQAKRCMAHIVNTGCRVQDLMEELLRRTSARDFVQGFFEEYVQGLFIADYSELRTKDHPLQHRSAIISLTLQLSHDHQRREALISWYEKKLAGGDRERAQTLYERDTRLLLRLRDVDEQLRRVDDEIKTANQQGLVLMAYSMRAPRNFDKLISRSLTALAHLDESHVALPAAPDARHASQWGLARPRMLVRNQVATGVHTRPPTLEELALESLRREMAQARMVKPAQLANYVARHLVNRESVDSNELTVESINDLCCYQRLLLIASRSEAPASARRHDPLLQMLPRARIDFHPSSVTKNRFMEHRTFSIHKEYI